MRSAHKLTTTFLAIEIPDDIRDQLVKVQKKLNKVNNQVVWEIPEKLHVTFIYLGRISDIDYQTMMNRTQRETANRSPIKAKIGFLGYFFKKHGTGIIWMGVKTDNELEKLYKHLVKSLNQEGFSLSEKKIVPHITLGRLKKVRSRQQMKILDKLASVNIQGIENLGEFEINQITILTSHYVKEINTTEFKKAGKFMLTG